MEIVQHQVIDNWHPDPDGMRQSALAEDFVVRGNYPGLRTDCYEPLWEYAEQDLRQRGYADMAYWPMEYNGAFQLCLEGDQTWVHSDNTVFAAVWFLTPNHLCPAGHGTAFYRHVETDEIRRQAQEDPMGEFEEHLRVEGRYNRLLIYDAFLFHGSTVAGFGRDVNDGRLTATFFWN